METIHENLKEGVQEIILTEQRLDHQVKLIKQIINGLKTIH